MDRRRGSLCLEAEKLAEACGHFEDALGFPFSPPERRLLETRLGEARSALDRDDD
jgi:hypothetical protein